MVILLSTKQKNTHVEQIYLNWISFESLRFPFDLRSPLGYAASAPFFFTMFSLICYSVMCALGMLLACFGFIVAFGQHVDMKYENLTEDYKQNQNDAKIISGFCDFLCFSMKIRGLSIFLIQWFLPILRVKWLKFMNNFINENNQRILFFFSLQILHLIYRHKWTFNNSLLSLEHVGYLWHAFNISSNFIFSILSQSQYTIVFKRGNFNIWEKLKDLSFLFPFEISIYHLTFYW